MAISKQLERRLENAIHIAAPSARIELHDVNGRASGIVIAEEFDGKPHLQRQQTIWNQIRSDLGPDSVEVGMLLLYSPEEADALDETVPN